MKVRNAPRVGRIVDAPWRVSVELAEWLAEAERVRGFIRTLPHAGGYTSFTEPLGAAELRELTDAGFGVTGYQIYSGRRQQTAEDGRAAGEAVVEHCREIGLPDGCTLFTDSESFRDGADTLGYIERWAKRVAYITDTRGDYVGSGFLLPDMKASPDPEIQGERLYRSLPGINRYWLSMSQVQQPAVRGACLIQEWEFALLGEGPKTWRVEPYDEERHGRGAKRFDLNTHRIDAKGGRVRWAVR
jgi:hypothetical protein